MKYNFSNMEKASRELARISRLKTGYGDDNLPAIDVQGPFVHVYIGSPKNHKKIVTARNSILKILRTFYRKYSPTDLGSRLILRKIGVHGDFLIVNQNADVISFFQGAARKTILRKHAMEFKRFATFLHKLK